MKKVKSAKIYIFLAALLFIAKPFIGFGMISREHPPAGKSILVKIFSKRIIEVSEDSNTHGPAIQNRFGDPGFQTFARFSSLLTILFPVVFAQGISINQRFLKSITLRLPLRAPAWLLCGQLII